jgi:general secretion pathway protein L
LSAEFGSNIAVKIFLGADRGWVPGSVSRMLRELLIWWIGQLADLVPRNWRRFGTTGRDTLVVSLLGSLARADEVAVDLQHHGRDTPLGHFPLTADGLADLSHTNTRQLAVLRLGETDVLSKTVRLPLAAERRLDQVVALEMDRETPFSADDVYWNLRVLRRDRQRGQLLVRLIALPRISLSRVLETLAAVGIQPRRVEISGGPDDGFSLPLTGEQLHSREPLYWRRRAAAVLCGALAMAAAVLPFLQQSFALSAVDKEISDGRQAADEAEKLRQEISRLSGTVDLIESERDKAGRPLVALTTLTRLIPDNTYLTELQQQLHRITLSGRSTAAARLIAALAASDQVQNPTFVAPVMRLEAAHSEIFTITLEVGP